MAVTFLTDTIRGHMDKGLLTGAALIDLKKAFDTVPIELMPLHTLTGSFATGHLQEKAICHASIKGSYVINNI